MSKLPSLYYIVFLYGFLSIIVSLFLYNLKNFYVFFQKFPKNKILLFSFFIFIVALVLREYIIPHMHHVYYDEFDYINIAKNIYHHNIFGSTLSGDIFNPDVVRTPIRPGGYPFLLNFAFRIFGDSQEVIFQTNIFFGALSVVLVFWIAYFLFEGNFSVGLWSALVFNFLPIHLKYSGSGISEISALFFILLAVWITIVYFKTRKQSLLYLLNFVIIFSAYIKPENAILYLFVIVLVILEYRKGYISKDTFLTVTINSGLLLVPLISQIPYMIRLEQTNSKDSFVSINNFFNNIIPNLQYLLDFRFHSAIGTIFFLIGSLVVFIKKIKSGFLLVFCFWVFYFINTSYFIGRFSLLYSTDSDRHFFISAIPFSVLAGYGIYSALSNMRQRILSLIFTFLILGAIIINSYFATKNITNFTFGRQTYKEYLFLQKFKDQLPKDRYVLCYKPEFIIHVTNNKVMTFNIFQNLEIPPRSIILFKGFWWFNRADESSQYEEALEKLYNFRLIGEEEVSHDKKYALYLLTKK